MPPGKPLSLFLLGFIFASCTVTNIYRDNSKPELIDEVVYFEPMNTICSIDFNNKIIYEDSLSDLSNQVLNEVVNSLNDSLKIKLKVQLTDSSEFHRGLSAISRINYQNRYVYDIESVGVPYSMDSALKANNVRFGLVLINIGTIRRNYDEFKSKVARNEIKLKYDDAFPYKYVSRVYSALIDTTQSEFILLNKSEKKQNPLDIKVIKSQVKEALIGPFFAASCCP